LKLVTSPNLFLELAHFVQETRSTPCASAHISPSCRCQSCIVAGSVEAAQDWALVGRWRDAARSMASAARHDGRLDGLLAELEERAGVVAS
jgi:hypothetical protein